jgi:hypothetical protein
VLHLQEEMANMEARIAAKLEKQQPELYTTAHTPTVQQESASPPAPDPQSDQLDFLAQQMSNMESRLTVTFGAQLQAQSQQKIAELTHQLGNGQAENPYQSPQRKHSVYYCWFLVSTRQRHYFFIIYYYCLLLQVYHGIKLWELMENLHTLFAEKGTT